MDKQLQSKKPWLKAYDAHVPASLAYPNITINTLFLEAIEKNKESVFIHYKNQSLTYRQIGTYVARLQQYFIREGLEGGERVGLVLPNIPQFVVAYYAILAAGGVVVAMNPRYTSTEFKELIDKSGLRRIVCLEKHEEIFHNLAGETGILQIVVCSTDDFSDAKVNPIQKLKYSESIAFRDILTENIIINGLQDLKVLPGDAAIFQFSGGTTGSPKPAIGMHKNIVANAMQFSQWCDLKAGREKILAAIPLYHVYGMVLALNMGVTIGAEIILIDDPTDIENVLKQIDTHKATFYPGVPTMYHAINHNEKVKNHVYDLTSIKACISGSFTLHPQIKETFEEITGGKLMEGYGLSEAPTATHCNPMYGQNKTGSIGLPLPDVEAKIVDIKTGQQEMAVGEIGELVIRGPQVMKGYYNQIEETGNILRDGWLFTGDIAKMDEDGYFFLVDRKKSLIKVNGLQVWPNEVESVVNAHPDVTASGVGGVPDMESGERVICWVVLRDGAQLESDALREWCKRSISSYKIPQEFIAVDNLPRTGVGKILRRELISHYEKNAGQ